MTQARNRGRRSEGSLSHISDNRQIQAPPVRKFVEVLSHPDFKQYVYDELVVRVEVTLFTEQLPYDQPVQDYVYDIVHGNGRHAEGINVLAVGLVRRCFIDLVLDHSLPRRDTFRAQRTWWYEDAMASRLEHGAWRQLHDIAS